MQKLHGISAQLGMFNRASSAKIERGAEAAVENQAQRLAVVHEEARKPKDVKGKKKAAEKESKPKASRMDDSSDSDGGKGNKSGNEPAKLDADSESDEDEQIASSKATAPSEPVNLMDDLLGMDMPQPTQPVGGNDGLMGLYFGSGPSVPVQSNDFLGDMLGSGAS